MESLYFLFSLPVIKSPSCWVFKFHVFAFFVLKLKIIESCKDCSEPCLNTGRSEYFPKLSIPLA